jgi:hypothetical protein
MPTKTIYFLELHSLLADIKPKLARGVISVDAPIEMESHNLVTQTDLIHSHLWQQN